MEAMELQSVRRPEDVLARKTELMNRKRIYLPHEFPRVWDMIKEVLEAKISTISEFERAVVKIGGLSPKEVNFFSSYFSESAIKTDKPTNDLPSKEEKRNLWVEKVIPFMQRLALRLPELFPEGLPILYANQPDKVTLTREQVACLLCIGIWGAFDRVVPVGLPKYPEFTFRILMRALGHVAAMECIMHYFERLCEKMPEGNIIVTRRVLRSPPEWEKSEKTLCKTTASSEGTIEDSDAEWHADFANEYIGGGVLHGGNVQEEILFLIKPECLVSMIFSAKMEPNESIIITGAERFSDYSGYSFGFGWAGPHYDKTEMDTVTKCLKRHIIAIDAIISFHGGSQFSEQMFNRDLNKAYCGFHDDEPSDKKKSGQSNKIATGNWGTGAFGGNLYLKAFQQILACSESERELLYFTFNKPVLEKAIMEFIDKANGKKATVGKLYKTYIDHINDFDPRINHNLLEFILEFI